jgi:1-acyl-sn-glycerol-3-phosphate acyltransferase
VWLLIHTIYRVRVTGMDNIPDEGPAIVASNHVSFVDPLIIGGMIRRPVNFVMYYRIYNIPLLKFIFRTGKAIPIAGRSENPEILEAAYRRIREALASGNVLGIFPEGRITETGEIQPFRAGLEKVVAQENVPVVPIALCNLWGSLFSRRDPLHKRRPYKLWAKIELRIGPPIPPADATAANVEAAVRRLRGDNA